MDSSQRFWAQILATLGSGLLLVSLWLQWFSFRIPAAAISQAQDIARQIGVRGQYVDAFGEVARNVGTLHVDAWQAFARIDVALAICGSLAALLAGLTITGRASGGGRILAWAGGLAAALCLYRIVSPPGPSGVLHVALGAYLALAAALALVAGGTLLDREPHAVVFGSARAGPLPATAPAGPLAAAAASVPPPDR